jgi:hypothetical protein
LLYETSKKVKIPGLVTKLMNRMNKSDNEIFVTIQSYVGDSGNRRNEGAFSPVMEPIGAKGAVAPFVHALENKKSSTNCAMTE